MKKLLCLLLTVLFVLNCGVVAFAHEAPAEYYENVLVDEPFTTNSVWINLGYNYQNQDQQNNIAETHNVKADSPIAGDGHGSVFKGAIPPTNSSAGSYTISEQHYVCSTKTIPAADGYNFSFDVLLTEKVRLDMALKINGSTTWLTFARMWHDGRFTRYDGTDMMKWDTNTWYHVDAHFDVQNKMYSLTVNDTPFAYYMAFTENITSIDRLDLTIQNTEVPNAITADTEFMYLDNLRIAAASPYSGAYTDDSIYNHVAFEETFENDLTTTNWETITSVAYETVTNKDGKQSRALKAQTGMNIRMNKTAGNNAPILPNFTSEELERVKISFDFKVTEKGTNNFFDFRVYDTYSGSWPYLLHCNNNGYMYSFGSYQGNGIVSPNPGYTVNTWETAEIYIDAKNKKMSIKISGKDYMNDGPLTLSEDYGWGTNDVRIDSLQFWGNSGTTYLDNIKYEIAVPEVNIAETSSQSGLVYYTYCPDLIDNAPSSAALLCVIKDSSGAIKQNGVTVKPITAVKLTASELSGLTGSAKNLTDAQINAYHAKELKFHYEKAAGDHVELYLWDSLTGALKPIIPGVTTAK